jgi:hypothetical protein
MKNISLFIVIILTLISCKRDPIPKDAIPRDQFVNILVDVHIAQGIYTDRKRLKKDSIFSGSIYLSVIEKHHVTKEQMITTSLYYSRHPSEYDKVFGEVLSNISLLIEDENNKKNPTIEQEDIKPE